MHYHDSAYGGDELGIRMVFERARQEAPCLLVFEDLDSLITENNRSFMLNEVDGLEDNDGMLMVRPVDELPWRESQRGC